MAVNQAPITFNCPESSFCKDVLQTDISNKYGLQFAVMFIIHNTHWKTKTFEDEH